MSGFSGGASGGGSGLSSVTGVQLGTSAYGRAVPLIYGTNRLSPNVIWMPHDLWKGWHDDQGTGKGGGSSDGTLNHFQQAVALALCEGPVIGLGRVWRDKQVFPDLASASTGNPFSLFLGARPQTPWSYLTGIINTDTRTEYHDVPAGSPPHITVTDPSFDPTHMTITTVRTPPGYSGSAPGPWVKVGGTPSSAFQYSVSGSTITFYATAAGYGIQVVWYQQQDLSGWALGYGGTAYVATAGLDLGNSNSLKNFSFEVRGFLSPGGGGDVNPADVVADFLTNATYGAGWGSGQVETVLGQDGTAASGFKRYCAQAGLLLSPAFEEQKPALEHIKWVLEATNSAAVWSQGALRIVPLGDTAVGTFAPVTAPQYDLVDFVAGPGEDPIRVTAKSAADSYNIVPVEYLDKSAVDDPANVYNVNTIEDPEQADVVVSGEKRDSVHSLHCITDRTVAQRISRILAQRSVYVRNVYEFKLDSRFLLLEPLDLVTLTEPVMGLDHKVVRIDSIDRDADGVLSITATDWPFGVASATAHAIQDVAAAGQNLGVDPGNANAPTIVALPAAMVSEPTIAIGTSSLAKDWRGAEVWISWDGTSYVKAGEVGQCIHGTLAAALAAGPPLDNTNTLEVDLSLSGGRLASVSAGDRDGLLTACWVGGEIVSYQTATLVSGNTYNLTSMQRGAFGTVSQAHVAGAPFLRLDSSVLQVQIPANRAGGTLYVKLRSFNLTRQASQDLASVTPYTFAVPANAGNLPNLPLPAQLTFDDFSTEEWSLTDPDGAGPNGVLALVPGGITGGTLLQVQGELWMVSRRNIPIDALNGDTRAYRIRVRYQQTVNPSAGTKQFYAGFLGVEEDGVTLVGKGGLEDGVFGGVFGGDFGDEFARDTLLQQAFFWPIAVENAVDGWHDYLGYWNGTGADTGSDGGPNLLDVGQFDARIKYVRLLLALNVGGDGTQQVDTIEFAEAHDGANILPYSVPEQAFGDGVVNVRALADGSVAASKLLDGAVIQPKIAALAVGADQLAANAVIAGKVAADAIDANAIQAGAVTAGKIAAGSINADRIAAGQLKTSNYAEDGSGNPTAGAKLDHTGTALKVAPGNLQIGAFVFQHMIRTFSLTLSGTNNFGSITLSPAEPDANYAVYVTGFSNTGTAPDGAFIVWTISKATNSITVFMRAAPGAGNSVTYDVTMLRAP